MLGQERVEAEEERGAARVQVMELSKERDQLKGQVEELENRVDQLNHGIQESRALEKLLEQRANQLEVGRVRSILTLNQDVLGTINEHNAVVGRKPRI